MNEFFLFFLIVMVVVASPFWLYMVVRMISAAYFKSKQLTKGADNGHAKQEELEEE